MTLRILLRKGKIKGVKIKKYWYVDLDSLREYINRNGTRRVDELVINGERAEKLSVFAEKRRIKSIKHLLEDGVVVTQRVNDTLYITESEMRRYDKRFTEYCGRKIIPFKEAVKRLNRPLKWFHQRVEENELETVYVGNFLFVLVDTLERLEERIKAGDDFLTIPKGRIRRAEVIVREMENAENERNDI
ncbi:MAG: hypothetical protein NC299_15300 [Lachnospiraceae bacterium]|nr:hypothetical protein [Lachnospiraceae bacterium]